MKRGDVVVVALPGDVGKPRPAVIVQSDLLWQTSSVGLIPTSSTLMNPALLRLTLEPTPANGLRDVSQVMTDKVTTVRRSKIGHVIGALDAGQMREIEVRLAAFFGLA